MSDKKYTQELINNLKFIKQAVNDFVKEKTIQEQKKIVTDFIKERQQELSQLVDQDLIPLKKKLLREVKNLEKIVENFASGEIQKAKEFLTTPRDKLRSLQENIENISPCRPINKKVVTKKSKKVTKKKGGGKKKKKASH